MEFQPVADDMVKQIVPAIKQALATNVDVATKRALIERALRVVGEEFYLQMFQANSYLFDSAALSTLGWDKLDDALRGLSREIVTAGTLDMDYEQALQSFFNSGLGKSMAEAFQNGKSMGKHPVMYRYLSGSKDCAFCRSVAGTHIDPEPIHFARCCSNCNCIIKVKGYKSRNGVVNNYIKKG